MRYFFLAAFLLLFERTYSQQNNLVQNGSFENYSTCPADLGKLGKAIGWENAYYSGAAGEFYAQTPDYFNSCANKNPNVSFRSIKVPINLFGCQLAKKGNGYAGGAFFDISRIGLTIRESLINFMLNPLKKNQKYNFRMYISLADTSRVAISNIQIAFFENNPNKMTLSKIRRIGNFVQIRDTGIIYKDKKKWTEISGNITANGGEKYLMIGNFDEDSSTTYEILYPRSNPMQISIEELAYYYVDDVLLFPGDDSYNIAVDSIYLYGTCLDSVALNLANNGDSLLDFTQNPVQLTLALKQGKDTVQMLEHTIADNQLNPKKLPLEKDSSIWIHLEGLNYSGNSLNYKLSVEAKMAADSFPPDNFIEVPALSVAEVSANYSTLPYVERILPIGRKLFALKY